MIVRLAAANRADHRERVAPAFPPRGYPPCPVRSDPRFVAFDRIRCRSDV